MGNILNHNRNIFDIKLCKHDYWDFHICLDTQSYINNNCLSVFIDANDPDCIWFEKLMSKNSVVWPKAINKGITLDSIGFTGIDNGLIQFDKYRITNEEFLDIFLNSKLTINEVNKNLVLTKVNGNNQIYSYDTDCVYINDVQVICFNGGFYQGFFKKDCDYQVLPHKIENTWNLEFTLMKSDLHNQSTTLNDKHPENKGIFFYIGTRSENKWFYLYDTPYNKVNSDVYSNDIVNGEHNINVDYLRPENNRENYFNDDYIKENKKDDYFDVSNSCNNYYTTDDYVKSDIELTNNTKIKTIEGYDLTTPHIFEYETDNKFITYNHTKKGFTVKDGNIGAVILYDTKPPQAENYFTLFNRTKKGYTTDTIGGLIEQENKKYDILQDLYCNALCFQIKDDGSVGYKYLVKNCEEEGYKIESEFSKPNNINNDEWVVIKVKIIPFLTKMRLMFFVNDKVVLVSKSLPLLNLKELDELSSKQEGIPYNISIGGGTQGLCDTITLDYMSLPTAILPLEKEFAGSFIGFLKTFKFYTC